MMKLAAVASLLAVPLFVATARAEGETTTTTANTVVVVSPAAPIMVNSAGPQMPAPALAPPGAAAPAFASAAPGAAPQNEDWSNVSHINGTPIPVGERGAYLYKFKKLNISANPFGLFLGYYDVAGSYAVSQNLAVSISATSWSISNGSESGYQFTASLPIYFRRTYSGPFLEPGWIVRSTGHNYAYAYDCTDCSSGNSDMWAGPEMLLGWHWTFDSGLNLSAAFGVAKHMTGSGSSSSSDNADANGYFRVGYAF